MAINSYVHVTPGGAGLKDGTSWTNAMGEPELETFLENTVVAGDVIFIKEGTYTLDSAIDSSDRDGTATSPIVLIGVKTETTNVGANIVYSDWARLSANRPFFDCGSYRFKIGNFHIIRNFYFQGDTSNVVYPGLRSVVENCKFDQDYGSSAARYSLFTITGTKVFNCEFLSANCSGLTLAAAGTAKFNYIHDMTDNTGGIGLLTGGDNSVIEFNIFNTCRIGVSTVERDNNRIDNNTFYETASGISSTTDTAGTYINNLMEGNSAYGFYWSTQTDINFFWKNHGNDARCTDMWAGVDVTTVFQDYEVSVGDPKFTVPGSNFSLQSDSTDLNSGMSIILGV